MCNQQEFHWILVEKIGDLNAQFWFRDLEPTSHQVGFWLGNAKFFRQRIITAEIEPFPNGLKIY